MPRSRHSALSRSSCSGNGAACTSSICRDSAGAYVAVEIKRRGEIDGVEQLSRYLDLMRRDTLLGSVRGIFAAQLIKPQARVLATDRGINCVTVDYDVLRGLDSDDDRLF